MHQNRKSVFPKRDYGAESPAGRVRSTVGKPSGANGLELGRLVRTRRSVMQSVNGRQDPADLLPLPPAKRVPNARDNRPIAGLS